ncbi:MAG: carbamoyltransferase [Elusimicrobiota bacterium]
MGKKILGISAYYHDAAAAIIDGGEIVAAAQEERFTRKKHDPSFPANAVSFCLKYSGFSLSELDAVVFYDKPWLKFERLLETYYVFAPKGLLSYLESMPVWIKEKLFAKDMILDELAKIEDFDRGKLKLLFSEHHLSHAASAFYPSPFNESAILTIDGVGEWATASIGQGRENGIKILKEMNFPHSLGLLYSAFTYYTGFKVNSGEYKLMGLAPYGNPDSVRCAKFQKIIRENIVDIKDDGSIYLNQEYFDYCTGLRMVNDEKWERLFGVARRKPETEITAAHCDLALAIQKVTEEIVIKMAKTAKDLAGSPNLCMAGGVALNCVANAKLLKEKIFDNIWIQPAAGDAGGALGAALSVHHAYFGEERKVAEGKQDAMQGSYLGPEFSDLDVKMTARKYKAKCDYFENTQKMLDEVASRINAGQVIGWVQGRMEWGPRALGNRSILGDARSMDMQKRMNLKIKFRESFRPFAPSVIQEEAKNYFETDVSSPYMLLTADVVKGIRNPLPGGYADMPIKDKLYYKRSSVPAITHLDYSARLQTVHKETNPVYWGLIKTFKDKTGCGTIINTSFNVRGEPIVCTPEDAYRCFMRTEMDCLVVGNFVFDKKNQPEWKEKRDWKEEFTLD